MIEYFITFVNVLTNVLQIAILGRVIVSWLPISPENPIVIMLYQVTEPILGPIRAVMPRMGMLDFSPIVAILLIFVVQRVVIEILLQRLLSA